MSDGWDGENRRAKDDDRWGIVIEIRSDVKHLIERLGDHINEDKKVFDRIFRELDFNKRFVYGCIGALVLVELVAKVFK